jgi:hypothetical protein
MILDLEVVVITPALERIMKLKKLVEALAHSGLPAAKEGLARTRFPAARDRLKLTGQLASMWVVLGARGSIYTKNIYRMIILYVGCGIFLNSGRENGSYKYLRYYFGPCKKILVTGG